MRQDHECDTDTLTLNDFAAQYGVTIPQSTSDVYFTLYPYFPTWRTPWNFVKGIITCVLVAFPILTYLGGTTFLALYVYTLLGPVAAIAAFGILMVYGWDMASDKLDKLWRIDDEAIREVNARG